MSKPELQETGLYCGVAAIAVFVVLLVFAVANFSGYSSLSNYLSDLGVNPDSALFFNIGAMIAGVLGIPLGVSLMGRLPGRLGRAGGLLIALADIALVGVGIFNLNNKMMHYVFASSFFVLAAAGVIVVGASILGRSRRVGVYSMLVGIVPVVCIAAFQPVTEHIAVLAIGLWVVVFSLLELRRKQ
jgi:hypothetical membrane protein